MQNGQSFRFNLFQLQTGNVPKMVQVDVISPLVSITNTHSSTLAPKKAQKLVEVLEKVVGREVEKILG